MLEVGVFWAFLQVTQGSGCSPSPPRCRWCPLTRPSLHDHQVYSLSQPISTDAQYEYRKMAQDIIISWTPCCSQDVMLPWWHLFVDTLSWTQQVGDNKDSQKVMCKIHHGSAWNLNSIKCILWPVKIWELIRKISISVTFYQRYSSTILKCFTWKFLFYTCLCNIHYSEILCFFLN